MHIAIVVTCAIYVNGSPRSRPRYSRRIPSTQEQTLGDLVFSTEHPAEHGADSAIGIPLVFRLAVAGRERSRRIRGVVRPGGCLLVAKLRAVRRGVRSWTPTFFTLWHRTIVWTTGPER